MLGNMLPLWYALKFTGLLRATADEEALGLDSSHHGLCLPLWQDVAALPSIVNTTLPF